MRNVPVPNELQFISIKYFFLFIRFLTKIVEQNKCRYKGFFSAGKIEKAIVKVYIQSTHI